MRANRDIKAKPPLERGGFERLALHYVGRYATTRAKLRSYLVRKLRERGWSGEGEPPLDDLIARFAELGYVDDQAFASSRSAALQRRGYGERRIDEALKGAGISDEDGAGARRAAKDGSWEAALRFAQRRRIGPFATDVLDRPSRERAFAAMLRAGHRIDHARRVLDAAPGEIPNPDNL